MHSSCCWAIIINEKYWALMGTLLITVPKVENVSKRHTHYYFSLSWDKAFPSFPNDTTWRREDE